MKDSYNPQEIEPRFYQIWEERGYFELDSNKATQNGKNFAIMMPPPNVTGALHMGHALTYTLQDIITRYKRMEGYRVLWQPGMDHAGIATQNVVERKLLSHSIKKEQIGREAFLQEVWKWKEESGGMILSQLRRLGASCSWSRLRFTMDKGLQNAVKKAFVTWYNAGHIVRGNYMVNWCTHDGALSDIEVEYEENDGKLYYIRYFLDSAAQAKDSIPYIVVATTRPETYFGDTAVMVNPADSRYSSLIGRNVILPLINKKIKIIADSYVDMEFGSGCVKVTPAHDVNDYEVGKRHNLEQVVVFDERGILNENCAHFAGLERLEAREKIVQELQDKGFIEKIESHKNSIGKCYRCGNVVEPYISKQWFVKKEIARGALEAINAGEARFYPAHWINNYNAWMNDLRDWCISRQLWWGHRIPVFYCESCGAEKASANESETCACGAKMEQDKDVLDTWFSSGLWSFSTLGWGNEAQDSTAITQESQDSANLADSKDSKNLLDSLHVAHKDFVNALKDSTLSANPAHKALFNENDLKDFYPNSLLITSFDILFFWVARMLFSGENLLGKLPFKDIYLHALICDENGQKMSKSKGNVINPLSIIEKHSSDILRFTLAYNCIQGRDIRISDKSFDIGNTLFIKIYNAMQFLLLYREQQDAQTAFKTLDEIGSALGCYMRDCFYACVNDVRNALDSYRFNDAASAIYRFLMNEFCDWGIEFVKAQKIAVFELGGIFSETMKLLHPFMPFLSEFVWQTLRGTKLEDSHSIMLERFPQAKSIEHKLSDFEILKDIIISIRRAKITLDCANKTIPLAYVKAPRANMDLVQTFVPRLAKCEKIEIIDSKMKNCIFDIGRFSEIYLPTQEINIENLIAKLQTKSQKVQGEIQKLESMLHNEKFLSHAPKELIANNESALKDVRDRFEKIALELRALREIER